MERIESPEIDPLTYTQLIFYKHQRKFHFFSTNSAGYPYAKKEKMNFAPYLTLINSSQIIDLNVKPKSIKLLEKIIREYLCDLGVRTNFLNG